MNNMVEDMREWLLECFSDEDDQEEIQELSDKEVLASVNRYFHGGVKEFMNCYDNVEV